MPAYQIAFATAGIITWPPKRTLHRPWSFGDRFNPVGGTCGDQDEPTLNPNAASLRIPILPRPVGVVVAPSVNFEGALLAAPALQRVLRFALRAATCGWCCRNCRRPSASFIEKVSMKESQQQQTVRPRFVFAGDRKLAGPRQLIGDAEPIEETGALRRVSSADS